VAHSIHTRSRNKKKKKFELCKQCLCNTHCARHVLLPLPEKEMEVLSSAVTSHLSKIQ
jgi:hypothetical protein